MKRRAQSPHRLTKISKLACLALLAALTSCSPPQKGTLRIGTNLSPGYEMFYLARERGWLDPRQVHLVEYSTATEVLRAFHNRSINAAALTLDEALLLAETGDDPRIVLVTAISAGSDSVLASPDIQSLANLRGRRIAVENTAFGAYLLQRALDHAGLSRDDVRVVSLPVDQHESAFRNGRVEALVTFDPMRSRLLAAGARELFTSKELPGEILGILAVRDESLERLDAAVATAIASWFRAVNEYVADPASALPVLAKRHQLSEEAFQATLAGLHIAGAETNRSFLSGLEPQLTKNLALVSDIMIHSGLLNESTDVGRIVNAKPLQEALARAQ